MQDQALGFLLSTLGLRVRAATMSALEPLDLTTRQVGVLRHLRIDGAETQRRLGELHLIDRTTMAEMLAEFEERGLIARTRDPSDGRVFLVSLTALGKRTMTRGERLVDEVEERFLTTLNGADRRHLKTLLATVLSDSEDRSTRRATEQPRGAS